MSFALNSEELRTALLTSLETNELINNYVDDITSAYTHLMDEYGSFTASGVEDNKLEELHNNIY